MFLQESSNKKKRVIKIQNVNSAETFCLKDGDEQMKAMQQKKKVKEVQRRKPFATLIG